MPVLLFVRNDDSFSSRFQFVGNTTPCDTPRTPSDHTINQKQRRCNRPQQHVSRQTPEELVPILPQRTGNSAQTKIRLQSAQNVHNQQQQHRDYKTSALRNTRNHHYESTEKHRRKDQAADEYRSPKVRSISSRDFQLTISEF